MGQPLLLADRIRQKIRLRNKFHAALSAEFFGTFVLCFLAIGIGCQHVFSRSQLVSFLSINIAVGFIVALCVWATYTTSGGQLNPAVTVTLLVLGHVSLPHCVGFITVQMIGAFLGAATGFLVYQDALVHFAGAARTVTGRNATAAIFTSFPAAQVSNCGAFADQVAGTALLLFFVCVFVDPRNQVPKFLHPLCFGFALMVIGFCYGMNVGYPINPARDLGPRLFAFVAGYGAEVFTYHNYYFWVPVVAPLIGGPLGGLLYHVFIGAHAPSTALEALEEEAQNGAVSQKGASGNGDENEPLKNSA